MVKEKVILERDLERYFSAACKKRGLLTLKLNVRFARGWPDRIVVLPGEKVLWVELKRPGGKTSALQDLLHADLRKRKHLVYVIDSKEGIDYVLGTA
jgi:hypothetical protein